MSLNETAISLWRENIDKSTRAHYEFEMGRALISQGEKEVGLKRVWKSLDIYPGLLEARCFLVDHMRGAGAVDQARALEAETIASWPEFPAVQALTDVERQIDARAFANVDSLLAIAAAHRPDDAIAWWNESLRRQQLASVPPTQLLASAEAILAIDGTQSKALEAGGMNAMLLGRYDDAVRYLDRLSIVFPGGCEWPMFAGIAHHCAGRFREALARFDTAILRSAEEGDEQAEMRVRAHTQRVPAFLALGDISSATQAIDEARAIDPENFRIYAFLAVVHHHQGRFDDAVCAALASLRGHPGYVLPLIILMNIQIERGEIGQARQTVLELRHTSVDLASMILDMVPWLVPRVLPLVAEAGIALRQCMNILQK